VWAALRSTPEIEAKQAGNFGEVETHRFRVLGPGHFGDARDLRPVGPPVQVKGQRAYRRWVMLAKIEDLETRTDTVATFCVIPLSAVRTAYPYSRFRITGFSTFVGGGVKLIEYGCATDSDALANSGGPR
jgi:hypothetical protein